MSLESAEPLILYATETGTAQDAADYIARQCHRIHLRPRVVDMDAYQPTELVSESLVIFVVSTTGSGTEPRSMTPLWKLLLRSDLPEDLFEDMVFTVFGLGDTSYEKFCWPAKKLCRRMQSLGATEILPRGEGDEQQPHGIYGALDTWMDLLLEKLLSLYPIPLGAVMIPKGNLPPPRVSLSETSSHALESVMDPLETDSNYYTATLRCNQRITAEDWFQDVRHFEFDVPDDIKYNPGDVAVIHPHASSVDVEQFLSSMGWGNMTDTPLTIKPTLSDQSLPDHLPEIATLRTLFTHYLDFNAVPRYTFFLLLRHFTSDDLEREKLDEFVSVQGADELYEYCEKVKRTIREVLAEFRHVEIPKEYIFDVFPLLRPREFSICSSVKNRPHQIHLCVAIVRYRTKLKIPRRGVCTSYLSSLQPGDKLRIGIRKGLIELPQDIHTPVICIGPGTGVAPMKAIIEERVHAGSSENMLYFGCRSAQKDQHYKADWASYAEQGLLTYRVACSRDGPEGAKRTYVQDLIREDGKKIWKLLGEQGALVVISGSSNKMPAAVKESLKYVIEKHGERSAEAAAEYVDTMEKTGRLIEECWS